jgi:glycosyltransferase involved in cell wall biosynthesis
MRIGYITGEYPPMQGGVGAYTRILAHHVAALGHDVHVLCRVGAINEDRAFQIEPRIHVWDFASLATVRAWAHGFDVVNLQYQTAAFDMSPYVHFYPNAIRKTPFVTTFHDLRFPYLFPKAGGLRTWIVKHLAHFSDGVITTNHEDAVKLGKHRDAALIPIGSNILKPLGKDFDAQRWRQWAGAQQGDFLLAYFGLINRSKGLTVLLKSFAKLRADGIPARLLIIGNAGTSDPTNADYLKEIEALIGRLELTPYVHRLGYLEDEMVIGSYLSAADAVVLPFADGASYRRGSLMAALRYGCPTVTTTPRVRIATFRDHDNLMFVPPDDAAALTRALHRLYASPALRARLKQGAAALAAEFEWTQIAAKTIEFYEEVIGGGASPSRTASK